MFELDYLLPLEREKLVETVENLHTEHLGRTIANDTSSFNLSDLLPKESDKLTKTNLLLDDDHSAKAKELSIRDYYHNSMQIVERDILDHQDDKLAFELNSILPKESVKMDKTNKLLDDDHLAKARELDIRDYYYHYLQPLEKDVLNHQDDKALFELDHLLPKEAIKLDKQIYY